MKELKVRGTQEFMGKQIKVIEGGFGEDCKVVSTLQLSTIHEVEIKHLNELFNNNHNRFKEGIDYIDLKVIVGDDYKLLETLGYSKIQISKSKNLLVYSERGYGKLIKLMATDLVWDIYDKMQDEYFSMRDKAFNIVKSIESVEYEGNIKDLVFSRNGKPITTSRIIANYTNKEHINVTRDIKEEIEKLKELHCSNLSYDIKTIIDDFKEIDYLADNGQIYTEYELGEMATMQLMLKYSTKHRANFIIMFQTMKEAIMKMFKVRVLESVIPQDNRLRQYVYIIENSDNGALKIGVGNDPDKRLKQLQTGSVSDLHLIYRSNLCSNAFEIESFMHNKFKEFHIRGEWYKLDKNIVINELEKNKYVLNSEFLQYLKIENSLFNS